MSQINWHSLTKRLVLAAYWDARVRSQAADVAQETLEKWFALIEAAEEGHVEARERLTGYLHRVDRSATADIRDDLSQMSEEELFLVLRSRQRGHISNRVRKRSSRFEIAVGGGTVTSEGSEGTFTARVVAPDHSVLVSEMYSHIERGLEDRGRSDPATVELARRVLPFLLRGNRPREIVRALSSDERAPSVGEVNKAIRLIRTRTRKWKSEE
ncbi:MAG: hypothetical protein AAFU79_14310 [Myxococcota bacterium]